LSFIISALFFSMGLLAQQTTVSVKIEKDGQVVKDTTYTFEDEIQAKHALKVMDIMSGDSLLWFSAEEHDGDHVKVMKYRVEENGDEDDGQQVVIVKSSGDETHNIVIEKEIEIKGDGDKVAKKEIKVIVSEDKDGEWTVSEKDLGEDENVEVIVIKENKK